MDEQATKFIVGLGNPGRQYERTRHNVGFMVLAELSQRLCGGQPRKAFGGLLQDARLGDGRVMLLAPQTFMNLSGQAVLELVQFYKPSLQDVLVVLDDIALPLGRLRLRPGGSAGGHKGLADILVRLGTQEVPRLRAGVGSPPPMMDSADYVLASFGPQEQEALRQMIVSAADAASDWVGRGMAFVMEKYNRQGDSQEPGDRTMKEQ